MINRRPTSIPPDGPTRPRSPARRRISPTRTPIAAPYCGPLRVSSVRCGDPNGGPVGSVRLAAGKRRHRGTETGAAASCSLIGGLTAESRADHIGYVWGKVGRVSGRDDQLVILPELVGMADLSALYRHWPTVRVLEVPEHAAVVADASLPRAEVGLCDAVVD